LEIDDEHDETRVHRGGPSAATPTDGSGVAAASAVPVGSAMVRAGTTSWADRSLVRDGRFYPRKTMTARERLAWYCHRLPVVEIATTYRFPPTPDVARQWVERSPDGFVFDVRGWSLLSGNPTLPDSLWPDLHAEVRPAARDRRRLYPGHLSKEGIDECWRRFAHALRPLQAAGRLGVVVLRYPTWFTPRPESWAELAGLGSRLPGCRLAVELNSPKWFDGAQCDATLEWLEEHGLAFVCVDGPATGPRAVPPVVAATADTALVRFSGRREVEQEPWTWPYRYRDEELSEWVGRVEELACSTTEIHLLLDNCWRSDAVDNACRLMELLDR
jgi:uncharacterized protein YecE (DUF72 family)